MFLMTKKHICKIIEREINAYSSLYKDHVRKSVEALERGDETEHDVYSEMANMNFTSMMALQKLIISL